MTVSSFVSRSVLPLLQPGFAGFLLHLRLPAGDQSQASGGDRSAVRKPALFLRRLRFGRGTAGRIHPSQRFKLPSIGQRRIWRGLGRVWVSTTFPLGVSWNMQSGWVCNNFVFLPVSWEATGYEPHDEVQNHSLKGLCLCNVSEFTFNSVNSGIQNQWQCFSSEQRELRVN